jgi:hypothetical protein
LPSAANLLAIRSMPKLKKAINLRMSMM